jgi:hypothetical protein
VRVTGLGGSGGGVRSGVGVGGGVRSGGGTRSVGGGGGGSGVEVVSRLLEQAETRRLPTSINTKNGV